MPEEEEGRAGQPQTGAAGRNQLTKKRRKICHRQISTDRRRQLQGLPQELCPLVRIPIIIMGIKTFALFDTGCPASLMSYSLFSNLPASCKRDEVEEPLITFKTASGEPLESQGQYYLRFKFCTMDESLWHKFDHPFHILPHLTEPCILGMDFIQERYLIFNGRTRNIIYNFEGREHLIRTSNPIIMNITIAKEILPINVDTSDAGRAEIIRNIIYKNRDVVALKLSELGKTTRVEHRIELEPGPPIRLPPYQLALHQRAIAKEQIEAMLLANVIRPSTSPYSAPVVLQKKPCGEHASAWIIGNLTNKRSRTLT